MSFLTDACVAWTVQSKRSGSSFNFILVQFGPVHVLHFVHVVSDGELIAVHLC